MSSSRLPGKVMKKILDKPIILLLFERLRQSRMIDKIILATSEHPDNDPMCAYVKSLGIDVFRGSENDVLERFYLAASPYTPEYVVRVTGDCPLLDPQICDRLFQTCIDNQADYAELSPEYAEGADCEILTFKALKTAYEKAVMKSEREHVTLYLNNRLDQFKKIVLPNKTDDSKYRFTVDEPQDFEVVKKVFEHLYQGEKHLFTYEQIKKFLDTHEDLMKLNTHIIRNEGLAISLRHDEVVGPMVSVKIGSKVINQISPTYIIAEMSANHGGDFNKALEILRAAKAAGADALKLQTYRADTITLDSNKKDFLIAADNPWSSHKTLYSLYEKAFTPWEWHKDLIAEGRRIGMEVFSSPFDLSAVDLLEKLNVAAYKIASPEISDIPLIKRVAQTGKPVIVSTGLAELEDIELAVKTLKQEGCKDIVLLKCTSSYPAPPEDINLRTIPDMMQRFNCVAGISDHTLGIGVPVAAVALGARVIEKHLMLDKQDDSVDGFFSLDPAEFKAMVDEVRKIEKALGKADYAVSPESKKNLFARRSLYIARDVKKGEAFTVENVRSVRPGHGLHPKHFEEILGKKAGRDLEKGDRLSWDVIA
jgi:N-acetylneuraminate synthase/pseudaminic acid synthase